MRPTPSPPFVPPWSSFRPETQRHLVLLWTDLLQRQLPVAQGRVGAPGETCHELAARARQMGWPAPQVEVIDEDLGLSGASSHARSGFQRLVAAIGLGEVGLVLVTEV